MNKLSMPAASREVNASAESLGAGAQLKELAVARGVAAIGIFLIMRSDAEPRSDGAGLRLAFVEHSIDLGTDQDGPTGKI